MMGVRREGMRWGQREGGGNHPGGFRSVIDSTGDKQPSPGGGSRIWGLGLEEMRGRGWSDNSKLSNLLHSSQGAYYLGFTVTARLGAARGESPG